MHSERVRQSREEALAERTLVGANRIPADRLDVLDGGDEAREQLVRKRPGLEASPERLVRRRPHLVRSPRGEQLSACEGDAEVGAEELVRRADEHVDAERGDVDRSVGRVMHGVGPRERAGLVGELGDPSRVGEGADGVRGEREGDDLRPLSELAREVVHVERRVLVQSDEAHDEAEVVRELEPGGDVRVVVEPGDDDLVAGAELTSRGARQREVERRHVRRRTRSSSASQPRKRAAVSCACSISASVRMLVP